MAWSRGWGSASDRGAVRWLGEEHPSAAVRGLWELEGEGAVAQGPGSSSGLWEHVGSVEGLPGQ